MPSYLLVALIWPLAYPSQVKDWVVLLPIDFFGIQTVYRTLFGILHNGGTWFVSCMLFAYLFYPVIKVFVECSKKMCVSILVVVSFLLVYSNVIIIRFSLDGLYSNPITRSFEFLVGVAFAEIVFFGTNTENEVGKYRFKIGEIIGIIVFIATFSFVIGKYIQPEGPLNIVLFFAVPSILIALLIASRLRSEYFEKNRLVSAFSGMSYQFFLVQLFLWNITDLIVKPLGIKGNAEKLMISFSLCTIISYIVWRFYDKPIRKILSSKANG